VKPAEVIYASRDPYAQKIFIDRGAAQGVSPGSPVADEAGVIGQVTRVHPLVSEVSLITNPDQATPVQVVRNGLRAIAFGGGASGMLELRFTAANAKCRTATAWSPPASTAPIPPACRSPPSCTSSATPSTPSPKVLCRPAAGVDRGRYVLVLAQPGGAAGEARRGAAGQGSPRR